MFLSLQQLLMACVVSAAFSALAIRMLHPNAERLGLVDRPDVRKHHHGAIPAIGGLCFSVGLLAGALALPPLDNFTLWVLATGLLLVLVGVADDMRELSVRTRLLVQVGAVVVVTSMTGIQIDSLGAIFGYHDFALGWFGLPFTVLAVVGLINAFNMLDGIDGLAGSMAVICLGAILVLGGTAGTRPGLVWLLPVLLLALAPFLVANLGLWSGRKIFMGDAGSMLIGYLMAWALIHRSQQAGGLVLSAADVLWCAAVPLIDTLAVMYRRLRNGRSPFTPDRCHIHHLLIDTGLSPRATLAILVALGVALVGVGWLLRATTPTWSLIAFLALLVAYAGASGSYGKQARRTKVENGVKVHTSAAESPHALASRVGGRMAPAQTSPAETRGRISLVNGVQYHAARNGRHLLRSPLRTLCVFGTRPEAIKMAPLVLALDADPRFESKVCVTGQHRQMLDQVLNLFGIQPDIDLAVMRPGQDLTDITAAILDGMRRVLREQRPDVVLVHGDTTTTLATTLAAYYQRIPVAHIEAGLRTRDMYSPWPEEANRKLTGALASLHFAPTLNAKENLLHEGISEQSVFVTGNTVIDALKRAVGLIEGDPSLRQRLSAQFPFLDASRRVVLVTGHRRENFGDGFERICHALHSIARRYPDVDIVYPVHLNPNVREPVNRLLSGLPNVHLIEPLEYLPFVHLMNSSCIILTDSGGIQEEAPSLGKPVLVMRDTTERPEAVEAGTVRLVGTESAAITAAVDALLTDPAAYQAMSYAHNPYGDGTACAHIIAALARMQPANSQMAA